MNCLFLLTPLREGRRRRRTGRHPLQRISTHAPAGGATVAAAVCLPVFHPISTHAPAGGATSSDIHGNAQYEFLLTPLREGRPAGMFSFPSRTKFLLTPLREGRRTVPSRYASRLLFLLTPLREGRRSGEPQHLPYQHISTHAPAGGATLAVERDGKPNEQFLLTPLREGRPLVVAVIGDVLRISTHAPAGGATVSFRGYSSLPV